LAVLISRRILILVDLAVDFLPVEWDLANAHPWLILALVAHHLTRPVFIVYKQVLVLRDVQLGFETVRLPADTILINVRELVVRVVLVVLTFGCVSLLKKWVV